MSTPNAMDICDNIEAQLMQPHSLVNRMSFAQEGDTTMNKNTTASHADEREQSHNEPQTNLEKLTAYINTKPNRRKIYNALKAMALLAEPNAQKIDNSAQE